jgi:TrmH family RNA methyltransferase
MQKQNEVQPVLARVRALQRSRGARDAQGQFWIEGVRQFVQAFDAGFQFDTIIVSRVLLKSGLVHMQARDLASRGVARVAVSPEQFRSISITDRASGIGAIVRQHWRDLHDVDPQRGLCWLAIEDLRSAGNLGTILRTAEATGASGIIFLSQHCDPFDSVVVRASMGGIFHLHLARATPGQLRRWAAAHGALLVALSPDAQGLWTDLPRHRPMIVMIGCERQGLSTQARQMCHALVRLPMSGRADSLNVGVATGVMLYELVRQDLQFAPPL